MITSPAKVDGREADAIEVGGLNVFFEQLHVLEDVSFRSRRGEFIAAVGPSGCGKSTLLNVLAGFIAPSSGSVVIEGQVPSSPNLNRGMVFQEYALFPWRTAWRNVAFALESGGMDDKTERRKRALELLELVNLSRFADGYPHQLSGGMKQRVAIARALANDPSLLLMDEPLGALDALTRESLMELIDAVWRRTKQTVVYITHNVTEAVYLGDRVLVFTPGPRARIKADVSIDLPRPRDRLADESVEYQRTITALVTS
ncbi:MAG: ABC transporter ATP-binding protein [Egibacteraceae bacterium]